MSGIGKIDGINNDRQIQSNGLRRGDVQENLISIFDQYDKNGDKVLNEQDGAGAVEKFWNAAKTFLDNFKGNNKTEQKGTLEDVKNATNQKTTNNVDKFEADGTYKTEVAVNPDGSKFIQHGGDKINVGPNGKSIDVTGADGKNAGGIKQLPNGMQVLTQADGKQGVFDPKKGEFLPDNEAQQILAQFG